MEVFLSPTFTIDVSSPPPCLFQMEDDAGKGSASSASSSSIGEPDDDDDDDGEEVSSHNPLGSLASLQDSLPVKKGLSNHFSGKSKSFANLSEASTATAKDLEKVENPINKRRRVLIACKWSRKSSFYAWHQNPKSMPLLALPEDEDDTPRPSSPPSSSSERDEENGRALHRTISKLQGRRSFKSASCFALSDLVHLDDDDHDHHQING